MQAEYVPKIRNAISRAVSFLDQILETKDMEQETSEDVLWHAAEEIEYAAAVLSLTHGFIDFDPRFEDQDVRKEVGSEVSFARRVLLNALETLETSPKLSYEKLRHAVQILRNM
jgi:hypothetical protein